MAGSEKKRSPWFYLGLGCGGLLLLGGGGLGALTWYMSSSIKALKEDLQNPIARNEKAKRLLGASKLPEGYLAGASLSMPFSGDSVLLRGDPPDMVGPTTRGFHYLRMHQRPSAGQALRDFVEGRSDRIHDAMMGSAFNIDTREVLARGTLPLAGNTVRYISVRGQFNAKGDDAPQGLNAVMLFDCPDSMYQRVGIWFTPDSAPQARAGSPELRGTPADEEAVAAFVAHFNPCQEI
ncbi:hypothetical protein P2318_31395 [Myxococcaceae bacterium GXIMD 01537]